MKAFANLYATLDETTKTTVKVAALVAYFRTADPADAAWAVYFLSGQKLKQIIPSKLLRQWSAELANVSDWLFEECYHAVGDLAETIALLLPPPQASSPHPLRHWVEDRLLPLRDLPAERQRIALEQAWRELDAGQRFVWNKLITGAFRVGVSQQLVTNALAQVAGCPPAALAHRLMGTWTPTPAFYAQLLGQNTSDADASRPYPFCLAHPLEGEPDNLGTLAEWSAEWKWDGIRAQLVRRAGQTFVWSRGEELVTERFPELAELGGTLPDGTVLDGEILPWRAGQVRPFAELQKRIGRKVLSAGILAEVPVVLLAYDLLEHQGHDLRAQPLDERRAHLRQIVTAAQHPRLLPAQLVPATTWDDWRAARQTSRARQVEGLMLKRRNSPYRVGRVRGDWWKWKVAPLTIDAVLIYAQRGSGKRASLYTDYTFGVWHAGELVPIAKAYSGLTEAEIARVDEFVKRNTREKFGPVRTVTPELVFELAFEGIQRSPRHKSGLAVRFPRIVRWRTDKSPTQADTLAQVQALLAPTANAGAVEEGTKP
jgi:DNA ligase-1